MTSFYQKRQSLWLTSDNGLVKDALRQKNALSSPRERANKGEPAARPYADEFTPISLPGSANQFRIAGRVAPRQQCDQYAGVYKLIRQYFQRVRQAYAYRHPVRGEHIQKTH